ncbi:GNAT family N-acetyltransferase [Defluviimonas salinarum]|uniref:L-ornithine N(alpha)-acyltransferase n=1 Tax=Defluviimonas salinarum TaxID=2992147 RepID=A0ABT3IX32_9RHOB|nr:GNAT family N-acetyltransferase [Defluviimonas salinarum]MCW3779990.1 GNAT family N-acetyltransferase [Defluviimonas salinarum]
MLTLHRGRYRARLAETPEDVARAQELRWRAFRAAQAGSEEGGRDRDRFDFTCLHVLVEEAATGVPVATWRLLPCADSGQIERSYTAQFYDLAPLSRFAGPMVEMGRFCLAPDRRDPDILRIAWGAMTAFVDRHGVTMLFGCASFPGTDANAYLDALAYLGARHLAPRRWRPGTRAAEVISIAPEAATPEPDTRRALLSMPPLLRSYLAMGGRVSDHAVADRDLGTLHVFIGLEVARVPAARVRALRLNAE